MLEGKATVSDLDGLVLVLLRGDLTHRASQDLDGLLNKHAACQSILIILDMEEVARADRAIVECILQHARRAAHRQTRLLVCSANCEIRNDFKALDPRKIVSLYDDRMGAMLAAPLAVRERLGIRDRRQACRPGKQASAD